MQKNLIDSLTTIAGNDAVLAGEPAAPYCTDWRGRYSGIALAVVFPSNTGQVAEVVRLCAANHIAIVPQGGNTSLCGGSVPMPQGAQIVLNLSRMNQVRAIDPTNYTMTVEAGCKLDYVRGVAEKNNRFFPLGLTATQKFCEIGGNLSTNAGGINVLRYGNTRDLVLGLEVVLPDGRIWNGLRSLRKDNSGYDLKHLFIGAEGTLGIITAAVLKLFPRRSLEQHAELAHDFFALATRHLGDFLAIDLDRAGVRRDDAQDAFDQHRLAGARAADDDHRFADADVEIEAVQDHFGAERLLQSANADLGSALVHRKVLIVRKRSQ